jgi:hypothetical protein
MGHPGAPDHDHHRSIWFAHAKVLGMDFWSDKTDTRIRQKQWLSCHDADNEAAMAVLIGWYDGHDPKELLEQELVAAVRPGPDGETFVELQTTFRPKAESLEFGQSNFGFLAVRVAKSLSAHFGGGVLTNSAGATGETAVFGTPAKWMDYSGPIPAPLAPLGERGRGEAQAPLAPAGERGRGEGVIEGVTYFDHPTNPNHPTHWHVRDDGWMGASLCMKGPISTPKNDPLTLRYLLHAHRGPVVADRAEQVLQEFAARPKFEVAKATVKHEQFAIRRGS